ncbi:N-(5'-phosphoribosyl)anthranilate isomerase [Aquirufa sp.]|jgi:phosphoribosylanthranilate isomerase|uniref:N-(5'-phosphoribosyl)anthranilate isomerase n=1 Tax=Aquirufa sp. TaxID=2676249 RepID=UPI0037C0C863
MLKTQVKVSSIANLSDARYCAGMGVEWLGFPLQEITVEKFTEIRNWLAGVQIVGEFTKATADQVREAVAIYQPDVIEVDSSVSLVAIQSIDVSKILRVNIDTDNLPAIFAASAPYVSHFLLVGDSADSLIGMEASIEIWAAQYPIILGLDIPEDDLDEWVEQSSIQGIGLVAGEEDRPGFRDFTDLMTILEKLETE